MQQYNNSHYLNIQHFKTKENQQKCLQISVSFFSTTCYENIAKIGITSPVEIIDKIFEYERYILIKEHLPMYKYALKDIEQGLEIILTE